MTYPGSDQADRPDGELPAGSLAADAVDDPGDRGDRSDRADRGVAQGADPGDRDPARTQTTSAEATIIETSSTDTALIDTALVDTALIDAPGEDRPAGHVDVEHVGLLQQAIRYLGTGVMSAVVDFGLLLILMALGIGYTPAKATSFVVGTITAYSLNRRFTFKAQPSKRRFVLTMLTYVITFALQVGIFSQLFPLLTAAHLPRFAVQAISFFFAQGAATVANFSLQRWLIFRPTQAPVKASGAAVVD